MRISNHAARACANEWLAASGRQPLADDLSYTDYATALRRLIVSADQPSFTSRADAVAYVRTIAREAMAGAPSQLSTLGSRDRVGPSRDMGPNSETL